MKKYITVLKDTTLTLLILAFSFLICFSIKNYEHCNAYAVSVFILAILLISMFTNGYFYGIFSSVVAIFLVNYAFTYPAFTFNFSLRGYPITFIIMLAVSLLVSAITTGSKQQAQIAAEIEKEKNRSNLLRAISHDIRTPLTSIMGSSSAFIENYDKLSDEGKKELVQNIYSESSWLIRVVENLLSITRINNENTKVEKNPEIAEEIIGEVLVKFKKLFPKVSVKSTVPEDVLFVPMDAMLIEQVIYNLLENAVIHGDNTTQIEISVILQGGYAVFTISDNGKGIKADLLPHLFNGYFVPDKEKHLDTKRNMGIGLSVCMTIIKAHDGTMKAYNKKDGGAVFEFSLPLNTSDVK